MSGDLAGRLRATFLAELDDQVRALNADLLALEAAPSDAERVRSIFRSAHAIKGAARVASVPTVEEACHALESLFARLRDGELSLDAAAFGLLFEAVDGLADARDRLREGTPVEDGVLPGLLPRLRQAADAPAGTAATEPATPARSESTTAPPTRPAEEPDGTPASQPAAAGLPEPQDEQLAAPVAEKSPAAQADDSVRVRGEKLDRLATCAGELTVAGAAVVDQVAEWVAFRDELARWAARWRDARARNGAAPPSSRAADLDVALQALVKRADGMARHATSRGGVLERIVDDVVGGVRGLRLRSFAEVVEGLPRAVRDLSARTGKHIRLEVEGADIEADRLVIDTLREPLLHLVRNAADHGIEPPAERERAGKAAEGVIHIAASLQGGRLRVVVQDDGRGVDAAAARARIRARGGSPPADDRQLAWLLLGGGISTRAEATELSGRGVGLDLVRTALERIGGTVRLRWRAGRGTRFTLEAPPSPAALRAVLVSVGTQLFALPAANVVRLVRVRPEQVRQVDGRPVVPLGDAPVPLVPLAAVLGPPLHARPLSMLVPAVILESGSDAVALAVDELLDEGDIVVRPIDERAGVPHISGGALLASGRIALVLTPGSLVQDALRRRGTGVAVADTDAAGPRHVLVVDDSITTRTLEQSVLEGAGYLVTAAVDGQAAWDRLQEGGFDLIVADVEMPRMDGFELCRRVRASKRFAELPLVLVTGLDSADDRARGLEAGADAYITKSSFDQTTLLDTIRQLIG